MHDCDARRWFVGDTRIGVVILPRRMSRTADTWQPLPLRSQRQRRCSIRLRRYEHASLMLYYPHVAGAVHGRCKGSWGHVWVVDFDAAGACWARFSASVSSTISSAIVS